MSLCRLSTALVLVSTLSACGTLPRGGYYEDDGPPRRAPGDLARIADAVPQPEPLAEDGNRPYSVFGRLYTPMRDAADYRERGIASWYGRKFHGRRTSSGEPYDMYAMTAAHRTLPLPTYVRVTNLANGRAAIVRVNDRGPFLHNRLIDLSYAAAVRLDILRTGTGLVELEAIDGRGEALRTGAQPAAVPVDAPMSAPRLYLQLGAFTSWDNAASLRSRLAQAQLGPVLIQTEQRGDRALYRVRIGPLASVEETDRLLERVVRHGVADARVVVE